MNEPTGPVRYAIKKKSQPGPQGNWVINRPDLGMVGEGYLFEVLLSRAKDYRKANSIPIGLGFEDELEQAICLEYLDKCPDAITTSDPRAPIKPQGLRFGDVVLGTKVMASFLMAGCPLVPREEAERRAAICSSCKLNLMFPKPCGGLCSDLKTLVKTIVGSQGTTKDKDLHACYICKCYLEAAVWIPLEIQVKPLSDHQKIQFEHVPTCWKKQSLIPAPQ